MSPDGDGATGLFHAHAGTLIRVKIVRHTYEPRGGALELFFESYPEVLIEGPAGTGKTTAVLMKLHWLCETYPGLRVLITRETRASMTESVLVTFEDFVLPPDHPARRGPSRAQRKRHVYPNGSTIVWLGMDMPTRILSSDYDVAFVSEATETTEEKVELVDTRLRRQTIKLPGPDGVLRPWNQLILDCNPGPPTLWLNKRPERLRKRGRYRGMPQARRILSRHVDNPAASEEYLERLSNLTGVRRKRYYEGIWAAAEGMFWPEFDPAKHMVTPFEIDKWGRRWRKIPEFEWYLGAVDWGFYDPGVFQQWGITADKRMILMHEIYTCEQGQDWWAEQIVKRHQVYPMRTIVCDSAEPDRIAHLNDRLARAGTRRKVEETRIAVGANKAFATGIDCVRDLLGVRRGEKLPRMQFSRSALAFRDPMLDEYKKPVCTVDEIPGYVAHVDADGILREYKEPVDAINHGCACTRYAAMFMYGTDYSSGRKKRRYAPGTMGDKFGHEDLGVLGPDEA